MAHSADCPTCGSVLVQPLRWQAGDGGDIVVDLRCPECQTWMQAPFTKAGVEALDRAQAGARQSIVEAYERSVAESMEALAFCLGIALEQDLVGADDFARPLRGRVAPARLGRAA